MHESDRALIQSIQEFFGGIGYVSKPNKSSMVELALLGVSTVKELVNVIIPHFENYPLITKKYIDYTLFKKIVFKILNKEHNTYEGLQEIVNIRSSLNLGLSNELKKAFPSMVPAIKPEFILKDISSSSWLAGFATGESNFFIAVQKSKSGLIFNLRFSISQHSRDVLLLETFVGYFGCGYIAKYEKRSVCEFIVTKIDDIIEHIIPFFEKHPIVGSKHFNFIQFKKAAYIIKNKEHLASADPDRKKLEQLLVLKKSMNKNSGKTGKE